MARFLVRSVRGERSELTKFSHFFLAWGRGRTYDRWRGMSTAPKIWIVDDDDAVRLVFSRVLSDAGYAVTLCADGQEAVEKLRTESPSLILLDVDMPRLNGWQTLEELRRAGYTQPILMITNVNDVPSRVRGLEKGADDYIGKPCSISELLARVQALLRRAAKSAKGEAQPLRFGTVIVDVENKTATKAGEPLRLSRTDYALLTVLRENPGKPITRERLLNRVWQDQAGSSHALDTHLWRLRKKIGDDGNEPRWILNVPGIGYVLKT